MAAHWCLPMTAPLSSLHLQRSLSRRAVHDRDWSIWVSGKPQKLLSWSKGQAPEVPFRAALRLIVWLSKKMPRSTKAYFPTGSLLKKCLPFKTRLLWDIILLISMLVQDRCVGRPNSKGCVPHPILPKQEKALIWKKMTDKWCKGSVPQAPPLLSENKESQAEENSGETARSSKHEMSRRNALQSLPGMIPTPAPSQWAQSFQDGSHASFWPAPADSQHLPQEHSPPTYTDLRKKAWTLQLLEYVGSVLLTCKTLFSLVSGAGGAAWWWIGRRPASLPQQAIPLKFCCWSEGSLVGQCSVQAANFSA